MLLRDQIFTIYVHSEATQSRKWVKLGEQLGDGYCMFCYHYVNWILYFERSFRALLSQMRYGRCQNSRQKPAQAAEGTEVGR